MRKKRHLLILVLLLLNLLFLGRLIVVGSRSKESVNTIHSLEQEKEKALFSLFQRLTPSKPTTPKVQTALSVSASQDSDIDEEELQRILQHVKHQEETGDALAAANLGGGFARTTLSSYWATVEANQSIHLQYAQELANFVGLLDLSSLKPKEADFIHQFIERRIRAANILYDGDVPVQEKVDLCKTLENDYNTFKNYMTKAIEINYGKALTIYRDLREKTSFLIRYPRSSAHTVGTHFFNSYKVIVPAGYQLEPLPENEYYE